MSEEEIWECEGCKKKFQFEKDVVEHEKSCDSLRMGDSELRNLLESISSKLDKILLFVAVGAILFALRSF